MDIDNTFILTPEDLKDEKVIYKNICIPASEKSLILGTITNYDSTPVENVAIIVYKQFITGGISHRELMGFTETDKNGSFAVLVEKNDNISYSLEVYRPLNNNIFCR
ncbi:hypothetical protein [Clostridium intestinale]|uniref:hypothetical protein n=1 Tax=Clostridium intestinale TaxID=36845 RepID=UPI002DD62AA4|nr:hypothetical protein [Clostridium intestinale]WRY50386.1 hypothetical protein P8F83_17090 [Clostridium intestinale]